MNVRDGAVERVGGAWVPCEKQVEAREILEEKEKQKERKMTRYVLRLLRGM